MHEHHHSMEHHHNHPMEHHHRHHHPSHRHHADLHILLIPHIERAHMAHGDIGRMSHDQLHVLANRVMHDSGVLHQMPQGHTEDTMRDMVKILLISSAGDDMAAVEAMAPLAPLALGLGLGPWGWGWPYWGWGGPWFGPRRRGFRGGYGGRGHHGGHRGGHGGRR